MGGEVGRTREEYRGETLYIIMKKKQASNFCNESRDLLIQEVGDTPDQDWLVSKVGGYVVFGSLGTCTCDVFCAPSLAL